MSKVVLCVRSPKEIGHLASGLLESQDGGRDDFVKNYFEKQFAVCNFHGVYRTPETCSVKRYRNKKLWRKEK